MVIDNGQKLSVALVELKGVPHRQVLHGLLGLDEGQNRGGLVEAERGVVGVPAAILFLIPFEDIHGLLVGDVAEDGLWVEHLGVDLLGRLVALAHHEDLRRDVTRCAGLMRLDLPPSLRKG